MSWLNTYAENIRLRDKRLGRKPVSIPDKANLRKLKNKERKPMIQIKPLGDGCYRSNNLPINLEDVSEALETQSLPYFCLSAWISAALEDGDITLYLNQEKINTANATLDDIVAHVKKTPGIEKIWLICPYGTDKGAIFTDEPTLLEEKDTAMDYAFGIFAGDKEFITVSFGGESEIQTDC